MRRSTVGIILILALGCVVALRAAEAQQYVVIDQLVGGARTMESLRQPQGHLFHERRR